MTTAWVLRALATVAFVCPLLAQDQAAQDKAMLALMEAPAVKAALAAVRAGEPQTIETQIQLAEIPAPSFKEAPRGEAMKRIFQQLGLQRVRVDKAGNVVGDRPGAALHPHVVVAAHLDTVFPEGTNVTVTREGTRLRGPGVGDDSRGLAVLAAMVRALNAAHVVTPGTITFVADVGEEGLGDLRGMKTLFDDTLRGTVDRFVTIDGTGMGVARTFVGSRRYRVTVRGPGGHSFGAFGTPNPINALGRAIAKIAEFDGSAESNTTFNVGRIGGGTSVNSIPAEAWFEVDLRALERTALMALDAKLQKATAAALVEENARWGTPGLLTMTSELVGSRPAGTTRADALVVQAALAATRAIGQVPVMAVSSSDANYPTSLGIPSVEIGGGGRGSDAHAPSEAFDTRDSWLGTQRALLLVIALAQN